MKLTTIFKMRCRIFVCLPVLLALSCVYSCGQGNEIYEPFNETLPSEDFYNTYLRSEWDDDNGPGGSGQGDNQGVGVPVGKAGYSMVACTLVYGLYIYRRRIKNKIPDNHPE